VCNRFAPPFLLAQRDPQAVMRLGGIRVEFNCPLEAANGLVPPPLLAQREPQVAHGCDVIRRELDRRW